MASSDQHHPFLRFAHISFFLTFILCIPSPHLCAQFIQAGDKLLPGGAIGAPRFGWSVSLSGDGRTAVVGGSSNNGSEGGAWVYTRQGNFWLQQGERLLGTGNEGNASQGNAVAISGDGNTIAISGPNDEYMAGAVWVFIRSGNTWVQQGPKLVGTGATWKAFQGSALALSRDGSTMLVGASSDSNGIGAAWAFARSGATWTQQGGKLVGTGGVERPHQGSSVCLSNDGNMAIIGATADNWDSGAVWTYRRNGGVWTQQGEKLTAPVGSGTGSFGSSVALSADASRLLVGAFSDNGLTGRARVYERAGDTWVKHGDDLLPSDIGYHSQFGRYVGLSSDGNTAVIGGHGDDSYRGACWVFRYADGSWTQDGTKMVGAGGSWDAQQGHVAISGDATTMLSAGQNDNEGIGAAWMFIDRSVDVTVADPRDPEQRAGGTVQLINRYRTLVASGTTNDSGRVAFYAVAPDTGYTCTVQWPWASPIAEFDTISWGSREAITLVSGRTGLVAFERNAPRIDSVECIDPATGKSVRGSTVYTAFPLRLDLRVRHGHAQRPAHVHGLIFLTADSANIDPVRLTTDSVDVQPDSIVVVHATFTPHVVGGYTVVAGVMTGPDAAAEATDVMVLRSAPLFTAMILPLPGTVVLTSPAANAAGVPVAFTLRWMTAARSARYHVQLTPDAAGWNDLAIDDSSRTDTNRAVTGLLYGTTYRWRVRAINITGEGPWSEERSFQTTVVDPTRVPALIAPANGSTAGDSAATLRWTRTASAVSFKVQVSTDSLFATVGSLLEFTTPDSFVTARPLVYETRYWWRVSARYDSVTVAGPSVAWSFVTGLPLPGAVFLVRPQQALGVIDTTTFMWNRASPGVTHYWFEQGLDSLFAYHAVDSLLTDTTRFMHVWGGGGEGGISMCYWRVRAGNRTGWGPFSEVRKLWHAITGAVQDRVEGIPDHWVLEQNYPNPFNPQTVIRYGLPERARVVLTIFNALGQQVAVVQNGEQDAGYHEALFDAHAMPSGVYFSRLQTGSYTATRKLILLR